MCSLKTAPAQAGSRKAADPAVDSIALSEDSKGKDSRDQEELAMFALTE